MKYLFFDTETTGFVRDWNNPSNPNNPRLVQLGLCLTDHKGRPLLTYSSIVCPSGFTIPKGASEVHGITTEYALEHGQPLGEVLSQFAAVSRVASLAIAHNIKFDAVIIGREIKGVLDGKERFCTMLESTNICGIPSLRGGYKWPKLCEAYKHFFREELKDAHDALTDVMACKRVFFEGLKAHAVYNSDENENSLSRAAGAGHCNVVFTPPTGAQMSPISTDKESGKMVIEY